MSKKIPSKDTIKRQTIAKMKNLGTYKVEFILIIDIFSDMVHQYKILTNSFEESNYQVIIETEKSDGKKSPILATLENLRKDIGVYSDKLLLNPKASNTGAPKEPPEQSDFMRFLTQSGDG